MSANSGSILGKGCTKGEGVHLTFCPAKDNRLLTSAGRLENYFVAIDLRLQSHRWMNDFAAKGGKIEIEMSLCRGSTKTPPRTN